MLHMNSSVYDVLIPGYAAVVVGYFPLFLVSHFQSLQTGVGNNLNYIYILFSSHTIKHDRLEERLVLSTPTLQLTECYLFFKCQTINQYPGYPFTKISYPLSSHNTLLTDS